MRTLMASALIVFLAGVVALCPALACNFTSASQAKSGYCHNSAKTGPDCPYSILQESKTTPAATLAKRVGSIVRTQQSAAQLPGGPTIEALCRVVDASGLFLSNRR
jgi:hypothetical protein